MSKVLGPLFSLSASKTLGKTITYQSTKSGHKVYKRTIPYDPKSAGQYAMRVYMGQARKAWRGLSAVYQKAWNDFIL